MNKKTTLNNFRKNFKISFSQRSSVSLGPRGCNGTRGSCVFCFSKSTLGSKRLFGVIFFF